jgi:hypothetical protein
MSVGAQIALKQKPSVWLGHMEEADWVLALAPCIAGINNGF